MQTFMERFSAEFREYMNENSNFVTGISAMDWVEPEPSVKKLGRAFGKEVGVFTMKDNKYRWIYIPEDEITKGDFKDIKLSQGEFIIRFITLTSSIGHGMAPLAKINPSKGLIWFLKDYESDEIEFNTKSEKMTSIRTSLK